MIIGTKKLLEMVKNPKIKLVENLCERELTNPEGEGFDLRVGEIYEICEGRAFLGIKDRLTPFTKLIFKYSFDKQDIVVIKPRDYRLIKTIESLNLPDNISCRFEPRTTLQRSGIIFIASNASPGYLGELTFGLYNVGSCNFELEMGARICTAIFHGTGKNISKYRGQWKGGRVSTEGNLENQV